jgi:hypothetical protein
MNVIAQRLTDAGCFVRVLDLPGLESGEDVSDWLNNPDNTKNLLLSHTESASTWTPSDNDENGESSSTGFSNAGTQVEQLLALTEDVDLFHTASGDPYASFFLRGIFRTVRIDAPTFTEMLRLRYFDAAGRTPASQALQDTRDLLAARAKYDGTERPVYLRVAGDESSIYIDLCNDEGQVVMITAEGWSVVPAIDAPVRFRRVSNMSSLPVPRPGGSLSLLQNHLNVETEDFPLVLGFIVQAWRPVGPYPVLVWAGEQGSGKSISTRLLVELLDPSPMPTRTRTRTERDLVVGAENSWLLAFDNVSSIPNDLSDAFCGLSTGGGFGKRALYTDRSEQVFYNLRPVILNGIGEFATQSDLVDRAITIRPGSIEEEDRKTESTILRAFRSDLPLMLGALCEAISTALRNLSDVDLPKKPRMADFAEWVVAAEQALPIDDGTFLATYMESRSDANEDIVANDLVASSVVQLLNQQPAGVWEGNMSKLLHDLVAELPNPEKPPKEFPTTYQALTSHLERVMPALRASGVERENQKRKANKRRFRLELTPAD